MSSPFLDGLWEVQRERGLSDGELAKALGISQPLVSLMKSGDRRAGGKVIRGAMRAFPQLGYLLTKDTPEVSGEAAIGRDAPVPAGRGPPSRPSRTP